MHLVDIILIILIAAYCVFVLYNHFKKDKHDCNGICAGCTSANCHSIDMNKIYKEIKEEDNGQ